MLRLQDVERCETGAPHVVVAHDAILDFDRTANADEEDGQLCEASRAVGQDLAVVVPTSTTTFSPALLCAAIESYSAA